MNPHLWQARRRRIPRVATIPRPGTYYLHGERSRYTQRQPSEPANHGGWCEPARSACEGGRSGAARREAVSLAGGGRGQCLGRT